MPLRFVGEGVSRLLLHLVHLYFNIGTQLELLYNREYKLTQCPANTMSALGKLWTVYNSYSPEEARRRRYVICPSISSICSLLRI